MFKLPLIMSGVREYCEEMDVTLAVSEFGRFVVEARNEGGYNATQVDLLDLLRWVKKNQPQIWKEVQ